MESYEKIFKKHEGFVSHKWVHYFYIYDRLFREYREKNHPLTIMEIGVDRGGSLEIWKKYLPEGSKIHGVDINPKCNEISFSENIFFHLGSAADRSFMEKTFDNTEFDIILDDGSHICSDVIETFNIMFPKIKNGGLYIIEDLHTSYWESFGGGCRKENSSIEYFKNFVEALNSDYISHSVCSEPIRAKIKRILKKQSVNSISYHGIDYSKIIESITFYDSICAVKKFSSAKNTSFKSVITGNENIEGVNCFINEIESIQNIKNMFER